MEAYAVCRAVPKNRRIENVPRCQCRWLQLNCRKKGVKLYAAQAERTVVVTIVRFILMRVCRIKPLSGQQNKQEQIIQSPPSSRHVIFTADC